MLLIGSAPFFRYEYIFVYLFRACLPACMRAIKFCIWNFTTAQSVTFAVISSHSLSILYIYHPSSTDLKRTCKGISFLITSNSSYSNRFSGKLPCINVPFCRSLLKNANLSMRFANNKAQPHHKQWNQWYYHSRKFVEAINLSDLWA